MLERAISWFTERVLEEYPHLDSMTVKNRPDLSGRDVIRLRICWGIPLGFTYFWADKYGPYGGMIIRPVNDELLARGAQDYWGTFFDYDLSGDICWVDYAYGAGLYPKIYKVCSTTGCARFGWRHRNQTHVNPFASVSGTGMKFEPSITLAS
jgi:hypothetical protein